MLTTNSHARRNGGLPAEAGDAPVCRGGRSADFLRNESGSATVWNLTWLSVFIVMAGLTVDLTNAFRYKTIMAATADAAATAGAWSLPPAYLGIEYGEGDYSDAKQKAFAFATANMSRDEHGYYILRDGEAAGGGPGDIHIGHWDRTHRQFTSGPEIVNAETQPVNAVHVRLFRNSERLNYVQSSLLQLVGLYLWNIEAAATAVYGEDACLGGESIVARGDLEVASEGAVFGHTCLHGHMKVDISPETRWSGVGRVVATTGNPDSPASLAAMSGSDAIGRWNVPEPQYDGSDNPIPVPAASSQVKTDTYPLYVDAIPTIGAEIITGAPGFHDWTYPRRPPSEMPAPPTVVLLPDGFSEVSGTVAFDHDPVDLDLVTGSYEPDRKLATTRYEDLTTTGIQSADNDWPRDTTSLSTTGLPELGPVDFTDLASLDGQIDANGESFFVTPGDASPLPDHQIYFAESCGPGNTLTLSGTVRNATFITNCRMIFDEDSVIQNVVALTSDDSEDSSDAGAVQIEDGAVLGTPGCIGGGVRLFSNGDIRTDQNAKFYDAAMFARSDIDFRAQSTSEGIVLHAGDDIRIGSNAEIGVLDATDRADPATPCPDGVAGVPKSQQIYRVAIVE